MRREGGADAATPRRAVTFGSAQARCTAPVCTVVSGPPAIADAGNAAGSDGRDDGAGSSALASIRASTAGSDLIGGSLHPEKRRDQNKGWSRCC